MLGVSGLTPNLVSNFRILVQSSHNKIQSDNPVTGLIQNVGDYDYYWFASNYSIVNPNAFWQYTITTSVPIDGTDVDLYVSVLDGRFPTSDDYDFASTYIGPDNIYIYSNMTFFANAGYNLTNGILFMVGVKALTPNVSYTLMMTGPIPQQIIMTNLTTGAQIVDSLQNKPGQNFNYYKWYNWGGTDFRLEVDVN